MGEVTLGILRSVPFYNFCSVPGEQETAFCVVALKSTCTFMCLRYFSSHRINV
jgi:hypothetical protein